MKSAFFKIHIAMRAKQFSFQDQALVGWFLETKKQLIKLKLGVEQHNIIPP